MPNTQIPSALPKGPAGATGASEGPDGKLHWHDIKGTDLGVVDETGTQSSSSQSEDWGSLFNSNQSTTPSPTIQSSSQEDWGSLFQASTGGMSNGEVPGNESYGTPAEQQAAKARHALTRRPDIDYSGSTEPPPLSTIDYLKAAAGGVATAPGRELAGQALEGFAKAATEDVSGVGRILRAGPAYIYALATGKTYEQAKKELTPDFLSNDRGTGLFDFSPEDLKSQTIPESAGKLGETILTFMAGDEALKGLSLAEKLGTASRIAKFAETSPRIAQALTIGMDALRGGTVMGAQEALKPEATPTSVGETVLGGTLAGTALPYVARGVGNAIGTVENILSSKSQLFGVPDLVDKTYAEMSPAQRKQALEIINTTFQNDLKRIVADSVNKIMEGPDGPPSINLVKLESNFQKMSQLEKDYIDSLKGKIAVSPEWYEAAYRRMLQGLIAGAGITAGHGAWSGKFLNDPIGAIKDTAEGALAGAVFGFVVPALLSKTGKILREIPLTQSMLSTIKEGGLEKLPDTEKVNGIVRSLWKDVKGNIFLGPTPFGTGPEIPGMVGETAADAANAAQTGLPEGTTHVFNPATKSIEPVDLTQELHQHLNPVSNDINTESKNVADLVEWETGKRPLENLAKAKAVSPAPLNPDILKNTEGANAPANARFNSVLKDARNTGSPLQKRLVAEATQGLDKHPHLILNINPAEYPSAIQNVIRGLQRAHLADIAANNPELATIFADVLAGK